MPKRRHLTFWQLAEIIPPILARLLARKPRGRTLTDAEVAAVSGLSSDRVFLISHMTSWDQVDIIEMRKFLTACNVDFCDWTEMNRVSMYLKNNPSWQYLRKSAEWKTRYQPLLLRYRQSTQPQ